MPVFASDTFTGTNDTDIDGRTPDLGGAWSKAPSGNTVVIGDANFARFGNNVGGLLRSYHVPTAPGAAEYDVQADIAQVGTFDRPLGPAGRIDSATGGGYYVNYNLASGLIELRRATNGVQFTGQATLGSYAITLTLGQFYQVRLEIRDATKKVYLDGVEIISSTDNTITAAGFAGVYGRTATSGSNTQGTKLDNFSAFTPGGTDVEATPRGSWSTAWARSAPTVTGDALAAPRGPWAAAWASAPSVATTANAEALAAPGWAWAGGGFPSVQGDIGALVDARAAWAMAWGGLVSVTIVRQAPPYVYAVPSRDGADPGRTVSSRDGADPRFTKPGRA